MAWLPTEPFTYTAGSSLNGLSGGTNWTAAWNTDVGSDWTIQTAPSGMSGTAARCRGTSASKSGRTLTGISAGLVSWKMMTTDTDPNDDLAVILRSGGNGKMYVKFKSNNIQYFDGSVYQNYQAATANVVYTINVEFDDAAQPDKYRVRVDDGAWTAWVGTNGGWSTIDEIYLDRSGTTSLDFWVDDIQPGTQPPAGGGAVSVPTLSLLGVGM